MKLEDLLNAVENLSDMVPGTEQVLGAIQLADQAFDLVATLIKDSQDALDPADLVTVHSALTDAIANRRAQQAITDAALTKASIANNLVKASTPGA